MSDVMPENKQYLEYIKEHKKNVTKAFAIYGKLMIDIMYDDNTDKLSIWERLYEKINNTHDDSKYEEEEFEAYRRKFFPRNGEEPISDYEFNKAWLHHIHNNPHHPEYWIYVCYDDIGNVVNSDESVNVKIQYYQMDYDAIIEMLCDWIGMGYKFGNTAYDYYYRSNKPKILHPDTKDVVEILLAAIKDYDKELKNN